jgi:argininosuccinate synthase
MKSRGVYETPGGTILYAAHRELELLCLDRDTIHYKDLVAQRFAELVLLRSVVHSAQRSSFGVC